MKKRNIAALAGVAAVLTIGGSLAYFNQTMQVENNFDTAKYGGTLVEDFSPSDGKDWEPGVEVNKDVLVTNTGDQPVVVRVKFDEKWVRDNKAFVEIVASDKTVKGDPNKIMTVTQDNAADGIADAVKDDSVVEKELILDNWTYNEADGYYYYNTVVGAGQPTDKILDSVTLNKNADMGKFLKVKSYATADAPDTWVAFDIEDGNEVSEERMAEIVKKTGKEIAHIKQDVLTDESAKGYSDANYTLTITADMIQATKEAVAEAWTTAPETVKGMEGLKSND